MSINHTCKKCGAEYGGNLRRYQAHFCTEKPPPKNRAERRARLKDKK